MKRYAMQQLLKWKAKKARKPLLVKGARQVGKTWLLKEFGKNEYRQTVYINFENATHLKTLFAEDFDIPRILMALEIETGIKINAENTLIIFDEIQEAERAITSLKYFYENAPQFHVVAAGSLLGIAMHRQTSFPVGKIEFLELYPFHFSEFLLAMGQRPLIELLTRKDWEAIKIFKNKYIHFLRQYYFIGGMPEAILSFKNNNNLAEVREIQKQILSAYEQDFSKHAPYAIVPRIRMLWNSIPAQLAKENKKFIYRLIKPGARAKEYELALSWLMDCGLVHKITRVSKPGIPLKAYEDLSAFKLFVLDVGLLGAMVGLDARTIIEGNTIFEEFKGALTEQYVLQQLKTISDMIVHYWSAERASSEIDFLIQYANTVIPIEVKAEENLRAKSLKEFFRKYSPEITLRTSMSDFRIEKWLTNVPLYAIHDFLSSLSSN
jgi:predicted AAA+ superfamily ATPase